MTSTHPTESELTEQTRFARIIGTRLLAFVCATTESRIESRLATGAGLDRQREAILEHVLSVARQSALAAFRFGGPEESFIQPLFQYDEGARTSRPNALRRKAGGVLPPTRYEGPAVSALAELARDAFPALLARPEGGLLTGVIPHTLRSTWLLGSILWRHPATERFQAEVLKEPEFAKVFATAATNTETMGYVWTSLGSGGSIQLEMLANTLVVAAHSRLTLRDQLEHDAFVQETVRQYATVCRLLAGDSVPVCSSLGFVGAKMKTGPVDTPWGRLRAPTSGETETRASLPVANSQELVLETEVSLEASIEPTYSPPLEGPGSFPFAEAAKAQAAASQRGADLLALSLLLGLEREPPVAIARTWTITENPFSHGPMLSWFQNSIALTPYEIDGSDRAKIRRWTARVHQHHSDRIDIATRRTLSALTTRSDPTDRLIDSVIALENLFGTGSGELVFRVSTGCARLLERDGPARLTLQRDVRRLYNLRSRVVHGAHAPEPGEMHPHAVDASDLAVRALRRLFLYRSDLIDNADRSTALIMG